MANRSNRWRDDFLYDAAVQASGTLVAAGVVGAAAAWVGAIGFDPEFVAIIAGIVASTAIFAWSLRLLDVKVLHPWERLIGGAVLLLCACIVGSLIGGVVGVTVGLVTGQAG